MNQLRLFPPPGAITNALPDDVQSEAREVLSELLAVVLERDAFQEKTTGEKTDEQDSKDAFGTGCLYLHSAVEDGSGPTQRREQAATVCAGRSSATAGME